MWYYIEEYDLFMVIMNCKEIPLGRWNMELEDSNEKTWLEKRSLIQEKCKLLIKYIKKNDHESWIFFLSSQENVKVLYILLEETHG